MTYFNTVIPKLWIPFVALLFCGCGPGTPAIDAPPPRPKPLEIGGPIPYVQVDDNVKHDTLLIQVTYDLADGSHLMVASHMEESFDGLRLYRYRARPDSSAEIIAVSSPAYDSWTMLPTIFFNPLDSATQVVLANFGERESWGQKVLLLGDGFTDLGFLDVALPEYIQEEDTAYRKLRNIAPYTRCLSENDGLRFEFTCDSVFLYDDLRGGLELMLPASSIQYSWNPGTGITLWVNGEARQPVRDPS
jgi:hypothetical protein